MFQAEVKSKIGEDISILLRLDNHPWNYLCECGDASNLTVKELQNCKAIFISHTHIDHFVNFDSVLRHQIGIQRRIIICGPKGIANQVQSRIKSYTWNLIEKGAITYEIREYVLEGRIIIYEIEPPIWDLVKIKETEGMVIYEDKSFKVSSILLDHKTPTLAYKFKGEDAIKIDIESSGFRGGKWVRELKEAFEKDERDLIISIEDKDYKSEDLFHLLHVQQGDSLGIIMDHVANEENHKKIKHHFYRCRQVFIESFYKAEDKEQARLNYHSYSTMSGRIMKESEIKDPIPVHFSRKYDEDEIKELINEFEFELQNKTEADKS
ncbi:peptidase [Aquimarina sp. 433]